MSEYEVYWLTDFPLIIFGCLPRNNYGDLPKKNQASKCKEKLVILQSIGIIVIKVRKQG